ncbi:MAG: TIGR00725 family protein, partial [Dehalococcoidia bacterium]
MSQYYISVIGASRASAEELQTAEAVGKEVAKAGAALVCGGLDGIMEAACRGAVSAGGITIGILPGEHRETANPYVQIPIVTGMGYARNAIVAKSGQAVIAIGGGYGTLSEIAYARQAGI